MYRYRCVECDTRLAFDARPPGAVYCAACHVPMVAERAVRRVAESALRGLSRWIRKNGRER